MEELSSLPLQVSLVDLCLNLIAAKTISCGKAGGGSLLLS